MTREDLKKRACQAIDDYADRIIDYVDDIYRHPELGFKEFRTTDKTAEFLEGLGLEVEKNLAITGLRANTGKKKDGPNICIMGELDSVITPDHVDAAADGGCHTCGHNNQMGAMVGTAVGIMNSGVLEHLAGSVEFIGVPAEEFIEIDYRASLIEEGKLKYAGGKQEFVYRGIFDDVDMAMMMHSQNFENDTVAALGTTSNGFVGKRINFIGREAHSGGAPHLGINALNAAMLALNNINAQRETFEDEDHIRVHPIITKGGDIVNVVPADVKMETYVRGRTIASIQAANHKVNNCLKAGAMATGAKVEIQEVPGYLPLLPNKELDQVFLENLLEFAPDDKIERGGSMSGSTDFGDITHIMPGIHPMIGGVTGSLHTRDYKVLDKHLAYIMPAKVFAMTLIDLLYDDAKLARDILDNFEPTMTKEEYLDFLAETSSKNTYYFED